MLFHRLEGTQRRRRHRADRRRPRRGARRRRCCARRGSGSPTATRSCAPGSGGRDVDEPVQEVVDHVDVPLDVHDLRHLTPTEQDARIAAVPRRRPARRLRPRRRAAVAPRRCSGSGPITPALRVHVPPLAARHERGVGDRGGVPDLRRDRAGARSPSSIERRPYQDHIEWLHDAPGRRPGCGPALLRRAARRVRLADPARRRWRAPSADVATVDADVYGAIRFRLPEDVSARVPRLHRGPPRQRPGDRRDRVGASCSPRSPAPPTSCSARPVAAAARACPAATT